MNRSRMGCPEFLSLLRAQRVSRRGFLQAGVLGTAGLTLSGLLRAEDRAAAAGKNPDRVRSVIILWMRGGPAQHETWDPKPEAPSEYRGEFGAISTRVPGVFINEYLPMSARIMDKWSIVRSLHHTDAGHSTADQVTFTGYPSDPRSPDSNVYPSCGSIVAKQLQGQDPMMPAYVVIPKGVPGTDAAYLGTKYRPFETMADPANEGPFSVPNLSLPDGISAGRLDDRRALLKGMDKLREDADVGGQFEAVDRFRQQAFGLLTSDRARNAFDLDAEPRSVRERYGYHPAFKAPTPDRCDCPAWSQRILLARRLVEAGVRLVTVDLRWWDTHVKGFDSLKNGFLARWDQAYSALIEDLEQRGLLQTTMVVAWGEFGRTPRVNATAGRDHWPNVFSAALAGGGIQGGRVVGSSDAHGGEPLENPKTPQDVLATMYRHLNIDTTVNYTDLGGRPHPVLPSGTPIGELF
ncbi:MAG TPA: DUF1501 domain-containing protein [Tepidisphaeraceae bacterium]|jgi:uncharacterized protein (DUF1501 family)|nr:DUF1501 domain-containing protein [Tepidisphaeraceae bacterium]